jgi:hypothetical protein
MHIILGEGGKGGGEEGEDQVQREADSYTVIKRTSETSALPDKDQFCRYDKYRRMLKIMHLKAFQSSLLTYGIAERLEGFPKR